MTGAEPIIAIFGIIQFTIAAFIVGRMLFARQRRQAFLMIVGFVVGLGPFLLPSPAMWWACGAAVATSCLVISAVAASNGNYLLAFMIPAIFLLPMFSLGFGRPNSADVMPLVGAIQILLSPIMCSLACARIGRNMEPSLPTAFE